MGCYPDKIKGSSDPAADQNQQQQQQHHQQKQLKQLQQLSRQQLQLQQQVLHNQSTTSNQYVNGEGDEGEDERPVKTHLDADVTRQLSQKKQQKVNGDSNTSVVGARGKADIVDAPSTASRTILETKPPDPPTTSLRKQASIKLEHLKDMSMHTIREETKTTLKSVASDLNVIASGGLGVVEDVKNETTNSKAAAGVTTSTGVSNELSSTEQRKKIILGKGYSLMDWIR